MAKWISKHEPVSLRLTVCGISFLLLLIALGQLGFWYRSPASWGRGIVVILLVATAFGLFRLRSWARWIAVTILSVLVVVLIIGVFNPFLASDMMAEGRGPPSVTTLLIIIVPIEVGLLWGLHILGKYKACFR
jgi:hypothetical protein